MESLMFWLGNGFWMLMIFDCLRNDPDRRTWLWILIFLPWFGAVLYFVMRRLPYLNIPMPTQIRRWTHRNQIWDAEAAAKNIGKAHQFVNLGNVLLDAGMSDRALNAYGQAVSQEPQNINALWGLASIAIAQKQYITAKSHLEIIMDKDPDHKFGEASLAYGQVLYELKEWDAAETHLVDDVKRWSHPEAAIMLAHIQIEQGNTAVAQENLETMIFKLRGTPRFYFRQKQHLLGKAQRMLRQLK
ncbi:MAG: tetratricopeptide repeat protein [Cyanothece sp. SIO2G6]|nr:tetratricopeptide repeat protein [Cyanothece sp. SIO2G6]